MVDYHKSEFLVSNSHSSICLDFLLMQIFIGKTLKLFILMFAKFEFHINTAHLPKMQEITITNTWCLMNVRKFLLFSGDRRQYITHTLTHLLTH